MTYPTLEGRADLLKMLDELTQARKKILEHCERLSAAQLADPVVPETWSLLEILAHLARSEEWLLAWIKARPRPLPPGERPAPVPLELPAIRTALDEAHAATIAFVKGHDEAVLRERCQYMTFGEQTVGGLLFHLVEHEIHHRAFALFKLGKLRG